ncbi:IgGFc-binding protein [Bacteroidota bacterium]
MKQIIGILILLLFFSPIKAEEVDVASLPKLLGSSNVGREFYFTFIPAWETFHSNLKLYISSNVRTKVLVEVSGKEYEKIKYTIPNDIIEFTLSSAIGQCYRRTDREPPEPDNVWRNAGVHIVADAPIICYAVARYMYSSDGFIALPLNVLGREYFVASFADPVGSGTLQYLTSYTGITAAYDNTKVRFTMGGNDRSKTASGRVPGETTVWDLDEGDVLLIGALGHHAELTGSRIVASNPVSVVSGNFCAYVPSNCGCCDLLEEMEIPTYAWGKTYHVTPIIERKKNSIIKIFAKEPYTKVYRDNEFLGIIRSAGGTEGVGYLHLRADEGEPRPIVISGDKPISVTQYNTGQKDDGIESDPFQMTLLPEELYQKEITFQTPGIRGGFGFTKNYINLCYESYVTGNLPDDLEIAFYNYTDSVFNWYKLKDTLGGTCKPFIVSDDGKQYYMTTIQ